MSRVLYAAMFLSGSALFAWGVYKPGLWPWLLVCMLGGALMGPPLSAFFDKETS